MAQDLHDFRSVVENYPWVTVHYLDDNNREVSIKCSFGQEIKMVDDSTIAIAWAVRENTRTRTRLVIIRLERVMMVIAEYPLYKPERLERLFLVRGSDGRFTSVRTEDRSQV